MKKVRVVKEFVSKKDLKTLNDWSLKNYEENPDQYHDPFMDPNNPKSRLTTRLNNRTNHITENVFINYPKVGLQYSR